MQLPRSDAHATVQDVNFQISKPKHRGEHHRLAIGSTHDRQHACNEFLRRERQGEDIVYPTLKRFQLGFEVAASRSAIAGRRSPSRVALGSGFKVSLPVMSMSSTTKWGRQLAIAEDASKNVWATRMLY